MRGVIHRVVGPPRGVFEVAFGEQAFRRGELAPRLLQPGGQAGAQLTCHRVMPSRDTRVAKPTGSAASRSKRSDEMHFVATSTPVSNPTSAARNDAARASRQSTPPSLGKPPADRDHSRNARPLAPSSRRGRPARVDRRNARAPRPGSLGRALIFRGQERRGLCRHGNQCGVRSQGGQERVRQQDDH